MTVGNPMSEIKRAIHNKDLNSFKENLSQVSELSFDLESTIITKHMNDFLLELFNEGKLSDKCRIMLGSLIDPKIRKIIKLEKI
jgi:hypothetical protein